MAEGADLRHLCVPRRAEDGLLHRGEHVMVTAELLRGEELCSDRNVLTKAPPCKARTTID